MHIGDGGRLSFSGRGSGEEAEVVDELGCDGDDEVKMADLSKYYPGP